MFPSGVWRGFWEQEGFGRQTMQDFHLHFRDGLVSGHGRDIVERFVFHGEYERKTGAIQLTKQYLGRHEVEYAGRPDGEGCIIGTWTVRTKYGDREQVWTGPFLLQPVVSRPSGDEPILEIIR